MKPKVIDLFAGCGGFSSGFTQAGFEITHAVEFDATIAETYAKNHAKTQIIVDDIKNVDESQLLSAADIIIGGPPCQGFSMAGARIRGGFADDSRNYLFKHYFNIVKTVQPKIFVMENVKGIQTMNNGAIFAEIIRLFENIGYNVQYSVFNASDFCVPQNRERMVIMGVRKTEKMGKTDKKAENWDFSACIKLHKNAQKFPKMTVWDAIHDLENLPTDGTAAIKNHVATKHNSIAISRIKKIAAGENFTVLDENIKSVHSGSYGRLEKHGLAPTITTRFDTPSGGKFIHPTLDRTLTPREAARIQSFSDDFEFLGNKTSVCKQIGNAVPPKMAKFIAKIAKGLL